MLPRHPEIAPRARVTAGSRQPVTIRYTQSSAPSSAPKRDCRISSSPGAERRHPGGLRPASRSAKLAFVSRGLEPTPGKQRIAKALCLSHARQGQPAVGLMESERRIEGEPGASEEEAIRLPNSIPSAFGVKPLWSVPSVKSARQTASVRQSRRASARYAVPRNAK